MTSDFFILDNPSQGSVHNLTLPTDSVVYIGYRTDSYPNIVFPFPTLSGTLDAEKKQAWSNHGVTYGALVATLYHCDLVKPDPSENGTITYVAFRLWTGCVPFQNTFTIVANGYSRTGSGTVTRTTYQRPNGETYMIDVCPAQNGANSIPCYYTTSPYEPQNVGLGVTGNEVWRDSDGNIIGGSQCEFYLRNVKKMVGGRYRDVAVYSNLPGTLFGQCPTDGTQVGDSATVEVSDGILEPATPITFTLNLNVVEKSYSFIQF